MTSGHWLTYGFLFFLLVLFPAFEFIQLYRRRKGNKSALTLSQFVTRKSREGGFWRYFVIGFPIFIFLVSIWLLFHFEGLCLIFSVACNIDI